jgi:hypothetical protein
VERNGKNAAGYRHVFEVIKAMPQDTHPMTLFSQAVLAMQRLRSLLLSPERLEESRLLGTNPG